MGRTVGRLWGFACVLALIVAFSCGCSAPRQASDWLAVDDITPGWLLQDAATDCAIAADSHGHVALTFVRRDSTGKNLWLAISRDSGVMFAEPVRVNARPGSVASYPEGRPYAVFGANGGLAITWGDRRPDSTGAVDVMVRASGDGGATFGPAVVVNDDQRLIADNARNWSWRWHHQWRPDAYHGFPALTYLSDGTLFSAWLDERENPATEGEPTSSSLYSATSHDGGQTWSENVRIATVVCPCCRPMALSDPSGRIAVAYRRAANDLRDPALAVSFDGGRTFPIDTLISADRWLLKACPDQGPAISADPTTAQYAWYTGAHPAGVYLVPWSSEHGASGIRRPLADSIVDARSPRLAKLSVATLVAVEARPASDTTRNVLAVRTLDHNGTLSPWSFLGANVSGAWIAAQDGPSALACWTEHDGEKRHLRVARLRVRAQPTRL